MKARAISRRKLLYALGTAGVVSGVGTLLGKESVGSIADMNGILTTTAHASPSGTAKIRSVATMSQLRDLTGMTDGQQIELVSYYGGWETATPFVGPKGGGSFVFHSDDCSALVASDSAGGLYVAPDSDPSGSSGAWIRIYDGDIRASWFGLLPSASDQSLRFQHMCGVARGTICLEAGDYYISSGFSLQHSRLVGPSNDSCAIHVIAQNYTPGDERFCVTFSTDHCGLEHIELDGDYSGRSAFTMNSWCGIRAQNVSYGTVRNCILRGFGTGSGGGSGAVNIRISSAYTGDVTGWLFEDVTLIDEVGMLQFHFRLYDSWSAGQSYSTLFDQASWEALSPPAGRITGNLFRRVRMRGCRKDPVEHFGYRVSGNVWEDCEVVDSAGLTGFDCDFGANNQKFVRCKVTGLFENAPQREALRFTAFSNGQGTFNNSVIHCEFSGVAYTGSETFSFITGHNSFFSAGNSTEDLKVYDISAPVSTGNGNGISVFRVTCSKQIWLDGRGEATCALIMTRSTASGSTEDQRRIEHVTVSGKSYVCAAQFVRMAGFQAAGQVNGLRFNPQYVEYTQRNLLDMYATRISYRGMTIKNLSDAPFIAFASGENDVVAFMDGLEFISGLSGTPTDGFIRYGSGVTKTNKGQGSNSVDGVITLY